MLLLETGAAPTHSFKNPKPTTASWRVELHLHFLIFYFLKKTKRNKSKQTIVWRLREITSTWLLQFQLPTRFHLFYCYYYYFVLFSDWLHSVGRKRETKSAHFSAWTETTRLSSSVSNSESSIISRFTCESFSSVGSNQSEEESPVGRTNMHSVLTYLHAHTHTHTQKVHFMYQYIHSKTQFISEK